MAYAVKEIFYSLQGEGAHTGRPAVFCRFAGCNLWTGREEDRAHAVCKFCDTDFVGIGGPDGGRFSSAAELSRAIASRWPGNEAASDAGDREVGRAATGVPYVIFTGGEPLLQLDADLIDAMHQRGFEVAIETNGTIVAPRGIDWICVSPKAGSTQLQLEGNELKLVYPQENLQPEHVAELSFEYFFLQPMDGPHAAENTRLAMEYCLAHPRWRLSLQTHKMLGIR